MASYAPLNRQRNMHGLPVQGMPYPQQPQQNNAARDQMAQMLAFQQAQQSYGYNPVTFGGYGNKSNPYTLGKMDAQPTVPLYQKGASGRNAR